MKHYGATQIIKPPNGGFIIYGGRAGTRTLDPLIKSQLLYQLSYASRTVKLWQLYIFSSNLQVFIAHPRISANTTMDYTPLSPCEFQNVIAAGQPCPLRQPSRFSGQPTRAHRDAPT